VRERKTYLESSCLRTTGSSHDLQIHFVLISCLRVGTARHIYIMFNERPSTYETAENWRRRGGMYKRGGEGNYKL